MPSVHCGLSFYSVMFLWLVNKSTNILILELTISLLTIYHRLKYKKHTLEQLIAGAILGCFVALFAYKVGNRLFAYNSPVLNRFLSK
jgi:membrane-associated phospholipid phosphatase